MTSLVNLELVNTIRFIIVPAKQLEGGSQTAVVLPRFYEMVRILTHIACKVNLQDGSQ